MSEPSTGAPTAAPSPVTKAVIPAAGMGTRFLPASKAVPKELLPIVDTPAIEFVVAEAAAVGARDILMITGRGKAALEEHFDRNAELERALEAKGDLQKLERVRRSTELATIHYVRQGDPLGLGHAVLCAAEHVGHEPFAVLLGDDLIDPRDPLLSTMIDVRERFGGSVIALMEVPPEQINLYGCAAVLPIDEADPDVVLVTGLVEKPPVAEAPSNLAVIGRYLLDPSVFEVLRQTEPGRGGEIQLTDALQHLAVSRMAGAGVRGVVFRGRRYDTGDRLEYLKAVVRLASEHAELGDDFRSWLGEFVGDPAPQGDTG
jgi:UTP--glucose-1-phosphate uridylyltransferase